MRQIKVVSRERGSEFPLITSTVEMTFPTMQGFKIKAYFLRILKRVLSLELSSGFLSFTPPMGGTDVEVSVELVEAEAERGAEGLMVVEGPDEEEAILGYRTDIILVVDKDADAEVNNNVRYLATADGRFVQ